jgi:hypothetical protein
MSLIFPASVISAIYSKIVEENITTTTTNKN